MTELEALVRELRTLVPHLGEALARDAGGPTEAERVTGGIDPAFGLPVNADVLAAIALLSQQMPRLAAWAARVVAEPPAARTVEGHLRHVTRWHERMLVTAATDEADRLVAGVRSLLVGVRLALGLQTPDRRLGQFCPLHDAPLSELVVPGASARLITTGGQVTGVEWSAHDDAQCRACGGSWPPGSLLLLGRQLREADSRRLAASNHGGNT